MCPFFPILSALISLVLPNSTFCHVFCTWWFSPFFFFFFFFLGGGFFTLSLSLTYLNFRNSFNNFKKKKQASLFSLFFIADCCCISQSTKSWYVCSSCLHRVELDVTTEWGSSLTSLFYILYKQSATRGSAAEGWAEYLKKQSLSLGRSL